MTPKWKTDRLFSGVLTLSQEGMFVGFEGSVESDAIEYQLDIKNQYKYDIWLPLSARFQR